MKPKTFHTKYWEIISVQKDDVVPYRDLRPSSLLLFPLPRIDVTETAQAPANFGTADPDWDPTNDALLNDITKYIIKVS